MSREIKFRVWNGAEWCGKASPKDMLSGHPDSNNYGFIDDLIFQQFTGKKDLNGKEIYEGDILEYSEGVELGDYTKCRGVVVYDEISCAFGIAPTADSDPINYFWEGTLKGFRVVGNIFEKEKQ
jgi:uncharacterized phage protein (TIGR01671 family)